MNWTKNSITIVLLLMIAAQAFIKTGIVVYYYANQSDIAQNWCVNRNQPETTCAGKCMVEVWMKKADNTCNETTPACPVFKNVQDLVLFFETVPAFTVLVERPRESSVAPMTTTVLLPAYPEDIFHPPA